MKCCENGPWGRMRNTSLSLKLKNGLKKLDCLFLLAFAA
jgi:hypothetical protein